MSHPHASDSDCTLNDLGMCSECGVYHGDPCPDCGQRGYHDLRCPVYVDYLAREGK